MRTTACLGIRRMVMELKIVNDPLPEVMQENEGPVLEPDMEDENAFSATGANPLDNEYILEHMLQYIILQSGPKGMSADVQSIRLVSSLWRDVATPLYLKSPRSPNLILGGLNKRDADGGRRMTQLQDFLKTMKAATIIPVQKFVIVGSKFYSDPSRGKLMETFLQLCGPQAVSFEFLVNSGTPEGLQPGWSLPKNINLSNLKTLVFTYIHSSPSSRTSSTLWGSVTLGFTDFVGLLLSVAGKLEEFTFSIIPPNVKDEQLELALAHNFGEKICRRIPKTVRILKLLGMGSLDYILLELTKLGLKLEEFSALALTGSEITRNFLESQAGTLKALNISGWGVFWRVYPTDAEGRMDKDGVKYIKQFQLKLRNRLREGDHSKVKPEKKHRLPLLFWPPETENVNVGELGMEQPNNN